MRLATPSGSSRPEPPNQTPKPTTAPSISSSSPNQRPVQPPAHKLQRPGRNQPTNPAANQQRAYPHQANPYQPSPSPSQLNNPSTYAAPPPPPSVNASHPASSYGAPHSSGAPSFPQPHVPQIVPSWNNSGHGSAPTQSPYNGQAHSAYPAFSPTNWGAQPSAPPPPPLYQPQPLVANPTTASSSGPGKPASSSNALSQGASNVVQGLMDKLKTSRR